jgi:hypothetical protein
MFKGVKGNDDFHRTLDPANKLASASDSSLLRLLSRNAQPLFRDVEPDHAFSPKQCHLLCLRAGAASEIEDDFIPDLSFDARQENSQLALPCVRAAVHRGRQPGSNSPEEAVLK